MYTKKIRSFAVPAILLVLLLFSALLLSNYLVQRPSVQGHLLEILGNTIGYEIQTEKIELNLWRGIGIFVRGLKARSRRGPEQIVASNVRIILDTWQLIRGRIVPIKLYLYQPRIELPPWNRQDLLKAEATLPVKALPVFWIPGLQSITVEKGEISARNSPFDLKEIDLSVHKKTPVPLTLGLFSKGKIGFRGEKVAFYLKGTVSDPFRQKRSPRADLMLETDRIPLKWIPWPDSMPVRDGDFRARVKIVGHHEGLVSVNGKISVESLYFSLIKGDLKKNFSISNINLDFRSIIEGMTLSMPSLKLITPDVSLTIGLKLDLREKRNPYLELEARSPFMELPVFKSHFPSPLLPVWVSNRLFPLLQKGNIQLERLALKGSFDQFRSLHLPQNHSAITVRLACKDFNVRGDGIKQPFRNISAEVIFENGDLRISGLKSVFGSSVIREAGFYLRGLLTENPSYDIFLDGIFDLQELMSQKEIALIPPDRLKILDQTESITGKLECLARFHYENGWEWPRIRSGHFTLRDCFIRQKGMIFPLFFNEAEILIDKKEGNHFRGAGSLGNSTFEATGAFGHGEKAFSLQWINISARADLKEVIPLFFPGIELPLTFSTPLNGQLYLSKSKEGDTWACKGEIDLEGVIIRNKEFYMDPPGSQDRIFFDLDFRPGERIDLKKIQCELGESLMVLSGFYSLRRKGVLTLNVSVPGLSLADLGIQSKKKAIALQGVVKGDIKVISSCFNPEATIIVGKMEGEKISFILSQFHSPIRECQFKLDFSGKKLSIDLWKMKVGNSPMDIKGHLMGWNGFKGEIKVHSNFLKMEDFFVDGKDVRIGAERRDANEIMNKVNIHFILNTSRFQLKRLIWGPLKADVHLREGNFYIKKLRFQWKHGLMTLNGHVKRKKEPEMLFSSYIRLTNQPIDEILQSFGYEDVNLKGRLTLETVLFMKGEEKRDLISSLTGSANVSMEKGVVKKSNVFIKVLDLLSLQKIFKHPHPGLTKEEFYFERIGGHVSINKGILDTKNFIMKSPVFNAVGSGKVDLAQGTIDFNLGAQPLQTVDTLVSKIPLLGYVLTGKEKTILTYYFKVRGPLFDPVVEYVPFKNLGSRVGGILKRLFLTPIRLFKDLPKPPEGYPEPDSLFSEEEH